MSARAITPLLFVGGWVPYPHSEPSDPDSAAQLIKEGVSVVVPDDEMAAAVLRRLGLAEPYVQYNIRRSHGVDSPLAAR